MTVDAGRLLVDLCEVELPVISERSIADGENETEWRLLQQIGALTLSDPAETVLCSACNDPHPVTVELAPEGGYRAYCPDTGWQMLEASALLRFAVDEQWIANGIRTSIGLAPATSDADESPLTRIGKGTFGPYKTELFFARRISERRRFAQVTSLIAGLIGKSPAILFATTDPELIPGNLPARCALVRLQDVLRISNATVSLDEGPIYSALRRPERIPGATGVGFSHSPGFRSVRWSDQYFEFSEKQAMVIDAMYEAWFQGLRLHQTEIQGRAQTNQRMTQLFHGHSAYGTLILHDANGYYWLDL